MGVAQAGGDPPRAPRYDGASARHQGFQAARRFGTAGDHHHRNPTVRCRIGARTIQAIARAGARRMAHAKNLIVVTNGALGMLPLSLLPTAPTEVKRDDDPLFSSYRAVPWLARTHAVTIVPSASALRTLRRSPPGKATRQPLIAFGDPVFNHEQAAEAPP